MSFCFPQKVLFRHCDPAGIVFYPRYFEMMNDCIEAFFDEIVRSPFEEIHQQAAVPTAQISVQFKAVSRQGDRLDLNLSCTRLGRSSLGLKILATCDQETRFIAQSTLVYVNHRGRPTPWPNAMRTKLDQQLKESGI